MTPPRLAHPLSTVFFLPLQERAAKSNTALARRLRGGGTREANRRPKSQEKEVTAITTRHADNPETERGISGEGDVIKTSAVDKIKCAVLRYRHRYSGDACE